MKTYIGIFVSLLMFPAALCYIGASTVADELNNQSALLLSQSSQAWQGAIEMRCRKAMANYSNGISGRFFSTGTAEKIYGLCVNKNLSR